jgi:SWI/SNF-related matrix-associated actin-dependent regulator of chromatin subfamily A member 5
MCGPHLVVVPLNVLETWVEECRKFCPAMKIVRYHGSEKERQRIYEEQMQPEHYDLLVTTYETLVNSESFFTHRQVYCYVIVDEAHRIKNENSLAAKHYGVCNALIGCC